jgi:AraC-like DNA-binding protein
MKTIPLHRVAVVRPFTNFLADVGAPFEHGFRQAGLPVCALEDVNNFIPSHRFWKFLIDMAFSQDIPDLGFYVGQKYGANCADPHLTDLLVRSPTLYQGLMKASEMTNRTVSHCQVGFVQPPRSQCAYLFHQPSCDANNRAIEQIGWYGILTLIGMARVFLGSEWRPNEIGVMVNHPPSRFIREQFAGTRIRLAQPYSWIALDNTQLSLPPPGYQAAAPESLSSQHEELAPDFLSSVKQLLLPYVCEKNLTVAFIAEACDMSKRSLQRRLAEKGTHYSEVLAQVRFDVAKRMLRDENKSVTDISQLMGYSDATHFARAFRRIAGIAPHLYRQQSSD